MTDHTIITDTARTGRTAYVLEAVLHYSLGIAVTLAAAAGIARMADNGIPACDSGRVDRTLRTIVRNGLSGATISGKAEAFRSATEARCTATLTAADGSKREMSYRVYRSEAGRLRVNASW